MKYNDNFYQLLDDPQKRNSAEQITNYIQSILNPQSVLEIGCGTGLWLAHFERHGIKDIKGIDGPWVSEDDLLIDRSNFQRINLESEFDLHRKYDLVVSLEVAEHLPSSSAASFVESLCRHSDIVLFSAAIPDQGGVHHVNEQWPDYWFHLFEKCGYRGLDLIRPKFWQAKNIIYYYVQNSFVFVKRDSPLEESLRKLTQDLSMNFTNIVHPNHYFQKTEYLKNPDTCSTLGVKFLSASLLKAILGKIVRG